MDKTKLSLGVGIPPRPPATLIDEVAMQAAAAGVDTLWCIDHFSSFVPHGVWDEAFSPFATPGTSPDEIFEFQTVLGYMAARSQGLRLGVGVTEAIRRHPLVLAQSFLTLSHLSSAPVILGIGSGERENADPAGLDFRHPVGRLEEALQIVRMCFDADGPFDFEGEHFQLHQALLDLRPGPAGTPEIWVAAMAPRMLRLTGVYADGWYPTGLTQPDEYASRLAVIREAATAAGRDISDIVPGLQVFVVADGDRDRARERLETGPVRLLALLLPDSRWRELGAHHPLGDGFGGLTEFVPQHLTRDAALAALEAVPDTVLEATVVWGDPADVVAAAQALADVGLRHLVLHDVPALPGPEPGTSASRFDLIEAVRRDVTL